MAGTTEVVAVGIAKAASVVVGATVAEVAVVATAEGAVVGTAMEAGMAAVEVGVVGTRTGDLEVAIVPLTATESDNFLNKTLQ